MNYFEHYRQIKKDYLTESDMHYIYFIGSKSQPRHFKVGISSNPLKRMAHLQIGNSSELYIYDAVADAERELIEMYEKEIHEIWQEYHIRGEWFCVTKTMINNLMKTYFKPMYEI